MPIGSYKNILVAYMSVVHCNYYSKYIVRLCALLDIQPKGIAVIKQTILLLIVLASLTPVEIARSRNDHLEPPPEPIFLSTPKSLFMEKEPPSMEQEPPSMEQEPFGTEVYSEKPAAILLDGFSASSRVCCVVEPAFTPEYA
jgi:hypothetical protein